LSRLEAPPPAVAWFMEWRAFLSKVFLCGGAIHSNSLKPATMTTVLNEQGILEALTVACGRGVSSWQF